VLIFVKIFFREKHTLLDIFALSLRNLIVWLWYIVTIFWNTLKTIFSTSVLS